MRSRTNKRPADRPTQADVADDILAEIAGLLLEATGCVAPAKLADLTSGLLAHADVSTDDLAQELPIQALFMATNLALFAPSVSGTNAFNRLARQRRDRSAAEARLIERLGRARFRLLRVEEKSEDDVAALRDTASGEACAVIHDGFSADTIGIAVAGWLASLHDGRHVFVGGVVPLDGASLSVAAGFVREGKGAANPLRCAEAVYRHVLRHGTLRVPSLDGSGEDDEPREAGEFGRIAGLWSVPGAERDPDDVQLVRIHSHLDEILTVLALATVTRDDGRGALSDGYVAILTLQLETVRRRAAAGSGTIRLDAVGASVESEIRDGNLPPRARTILDEARRRMGTAAAGRDATVDRLIGRIQALRSKTVAHGCTEQEALAAASKAAELLDRHGLGLGELDGRRDACEGAAVETGRKRTSALDQCVPAIGSFFDCRYWGEKDVSGGLRWIFFGLPADVAAARYLYDLVAIVFDTETRDFRAGPTYEAMPTGSRRTATNSFQIGLSHGIASKLSQLRAAREAVLRGGSGRDLVVAKSDLVEREFASLGLQLREQNKAGARRVLQDPFEEGHEAGLEFEYVEGIGHDG